MKSAYVRCIISAIIFLLLSSGVSICTAKQAKSGTDDTVKVQNNANKINPKAQARDPHYRSPAPGNSCGSYADLVISAIEAKPGSGDSYVMKVTVHNRCSTAARNVEITFWSDVDSTHKVIPPISTTIAGSATVQTGWIFMPVNSDGSTILWAEVKCSNERKFSGNKKSKRVP